MDVAATSSTCGQVVAGVADAELLLADEPDADEELEDDEPDDSEDDDDVDAAEPDFSPDFSPDDDFAAALFFAPSRESVR